MSPDDIFAAQFWPWPDPAIKRDAQGRILFVNAAFLALYGGRVEDWRGNAIGGWPAPQVTAQHAVPYRFETRLPAADGSEQVYDWIEQTLADGNAFALARNVTVFTQRPDPDPSQFVTQEQNYQAQQTQVQTSQHEAPPLAQQAATYQAEQHLPAENNVQFEEPQVEVQAEAETQYMEPVFEAPAIEEAPLAQAPVSQAPVSQTASDPINVPEIDIPNIDIPSDDAYAMTNMEAAVEPAPAPQVEISAEPKAEREFERRALPIESGSSVLGNNWRDAVIAKAVGADDVASDGASTMGNVKIEKVDTPNVTSDQAGPIRILLAEDNAINALLTRTLLEAEGHTVDTVEDGALAVEAMKTTRYDLIFMDMRMPNMDGLEATRKIRGLPNVGYGLPIIALTANAFDDDRNACFDSGMNDFMTKPVSAEELSEKVSDWTSAEAKARLSKAA